MRINTISESQILTVKEKDENTTGIGFITLVYLLNLTIFINIIDSTDI